jgi:DNA repair protein RecN (Recombination protein N)
LLITHWPQLAARAQRHFYVSKDVRNNETFTFCIQLNPEDIKKELGRMGGGGAQAEDFAHSLLTRQSSSKTKLS